MRVLLIDDDPEILSVIRLAMKVKGHTMLGALSGPEGIELARKELPELILLDVMMPDMDGYEVYQKLAEDEDTRDIPVMFLTAKAKLEYREKGLAMGAKGYITKPFSVEELLKRMEEAAEG